MPPNAKTSGSSAEAGVHCCVFRKVWHQATWFGQLHIFHCLYCLKSTLLRGVTMTWAFLQFHETECSFTDTHCFCLWFDTNYIFLPYLLLLGQFLNYGIVLCFNFPLLGFLISLLNCAESWLNYDAAESFFQLQESIKGLKGSEVPPRETMLICPCHTVVIWMGKSQTDRIFWDTRIKVNVWKTLTALETAKAGSNDPKQSNVFVLSLIVGASKSVKLYFEITL